MPKGPQGQKRHADVIKNAVHVMRIATGEVVDEKSKTPGRAAGGKAGGKARAKVLSPEKRKEIAALAAKKRWAKKNIE